MLLNWMSVLWLLTICTVALLGIFHLSVWARQRDQHQHAVLACLSFLVMFSGVAELRSFAAQTPAEYADTLRWAHVFGSLILITVVFHLQTTMAGRPWLAWTIYASRVISIAANFTTGVSLSFLSIDELQMVSVWRNASFPIPVGTPNPWFLVAQLSNVLLVIYFVDTLYRLSRQPKTDMRRRDVQTISAILGFVLTAVLAANLIVLFGASLPMMNSIPFLFVALVMNHQLAGDLVRAAGLARALQLSESTLQRFDSDMQLAGRVVGLGLWRWDARTQQIWLSARSAQLFGHEREGLYGQDAILARIDAEDLARMRASNQAGADGSAESSGEFRIIRASDGERRWLAAHALHVLRPNTGELEQAHGVIIDLTDQRALGEIFRLVFEATPNAMLLVGAQGNIVLANLAAAELSGYAVGELLGMNIDTLVPADERERHAGLRSEYAAAAARRQMRPMREVRLHRREGDSRLIEVTLNPIEVDNQSMVVVAIQDLSARQSRDRDAALQRAALAHVARVGMLAELSGSLAHEINQPLAAILSNAQASLRFVSRPEPELGEVTEGLREIVDNAKRAGEVIRRLRAMLRNEAPEFTVLDVNEEVRSMVQLLHSELIERGVLVAVDYADSLPRVRGDRVQLQRVLLNLIVNAADAMEACEPPRRIHISTRLDNQGVLIDVSDHGPGVPEADRERIFQAFVSSKASGLGFGLALSKTLVEAHGGRIWVTDNPPPMPGACFHLWLPAAV